MKGREEGLRLQPPDARRGGLVIVCPPVAEAGRLAASYAEGGYETMVAATSEALGRAIASLAPPVFVLAYADGAHAAWRLSAGAAVSIVADARIGDVIAQSPGLPTILHLTADAHGALATALEASHPDLPVHLHDGGEDARRLLRLRTLRLFAVNAGDRAEF